MIAPEELASRQTIQSPIVFATVTPYTLGMKQLHALKLGDAIGIAAPASPFDKNRFTKGIKVLKDLGFNPIYSHDIFDQNRYLAGTDERRSKELMELICNPKVMAIMFARGGYGCQRVIPLLDVEKIKKHRKPVIGFSDITALLNFLSQEADIPTFYGPVITQLGKKNSSITKESLLLALTTDGPLGAMPTAGTHVIRSGQASGKLVGGCLSLINSSIGTPYELNSEGCILFIEDTGEKVYVLDRMLTQLKNSGKLEAATGIIFGSLIPPEEEPHDIESMIEDVLGDFEGPVVTRFSAGHIDDFVTLPLGVGAQIIANNESVEIKYTDSSFG
jgi:muramoyltetrapeptide carboxypeptidase